MHSRLPPEAVKVNCRRHWGKGGRLGSEKPLSKPSPSATLICDLNGKVKGPASPVRRPPASQPCGVPLCPSSPDVQQGSRLAVPVRGGGADGGVRPTPPYRTHAGLPRAANHLSALSSTRRSLTRLSPAESRQLFTGPTPAGQVRGQKPTDGKRKHGFSPRGGNDRS
ncbi:hypothetical protein JX265_000266 [Neoarthrinium moseri]|uniref:Uncharacterized protein n=1 Tax=Neoarthrinium moseri TaxID=1658444 RepID=A0A9P9WYQ2_9PEZI|nr:hypothetical protein JX265_000266 [Neoarthrinium moseri]